MTTATRKRRNPYRTPKGFVPNPFTPLYQEPDVDPSEDLSVQEILDYALTLEDQVPGDFNLSQVVNEIKSNCLSFVRTGLLAYKVKVYKIYRNVHRNFKEFCEKALGVSHWQINRTIEAARVVLELAQNGFDILPKCEAQCRPLAKFTGAELCANWQSVLDTTPPHRITGKAINEALGIENNSESVRLSPAVYKWLKEKALQEGTSIDGFLKELIGMYNDTTTQKVDQQKLEEWEEDLQALVQEEELSQAQQTEALNDRDDEQVNKRASDGPTLVDSSSPASDEQPMQPTSYDFEAASVVIKGFGILSGCQAQSEPLTNLYGPEWCANWLSCQDSTSVEWCANWLSFPDATPVRKISSNAIHEVPEMEKEYEKEYEYVTLSPDVYYPLEEKAQLAGMSIDELLKEMMRNWTTTEKVDQAEQKKPKRRATKPKARSKRGFG